MKKTLGGDRLGAGNKQQIEMNNYERSTHDLSFVWRSSMSAGTLVPFLSEVALSGDTWEIELNAVVKTHPTVGPLFGSYKVQLDVFQIPMRLYNSWLHNNKLGIGMRMQDIKLPYIEVEAGRSATPDGEFINSSHILNYLGLKGIGHVPQGAANPYYKLQFNAVPLLCYYDIYKNYYANKQEINGYVIHTDPVSSALVITSITLYQYGNAPVLVPNSSTGTPVAYSIGNFEIITIEILFTTPPPDYDVLQLIQLATESGLRNITGGDKWTMTNASIAGNTITVTIEVFINTGFYSYEYNSAPSPAPKAPTLYPFQITEIDDMRESMLTQPGNIGYDVSGSGFNLTQKLFVGAPGYNANQNKYNQEGLLVKTYQSDIFNNWVNTDWITDAGGVNDLSKIDTSAGYFNIDSLILGNKIYKMLMRIAVSDGTYNSWLDATYTHERFAAPEIPVYEGGLSKELVFEEIFSNSASSDQPLGTLAGKGVMSKKHKGGHLFIKVNEPSYIMGIVSLTPRIDYSQGNRWDMELESIDDLHKPALDGIGFQDLLGSKMAWWNKKYTPGVGWEDKVVGKQPAWIDYMTNYNRTFGSFAEQDNEMFMTLNRRYEWRPNTMADVTTYIDPSKFNYIFAQTSIDAQNFWTQIAVDAKVRRKMSAKVMPNL